MIYGRVIGNELRDVPPECLPIWGQRWSGYRAPCGPSPFSTRIFSVDRMSEVGPALTSPAQFEAMLTEEDEGEDTGSEPGQLYSAFPSSPLAVQPAHWISSPKTPTPRSVYRGSSYSPRSEIHHQSTRHSTPQNSACLGTTFLSGQRSEQPHTNPHLSERLFQPSTTGYGTTPQGGYGSFENDHTFWDMDQTLTSIHPGADPSLGSHVPCGGLHYATPLHSIPGGQFAADVRTKSSADPFHPNPLSCLCDGYHLQPSQADGQNRFIPVMSPSAYHFVPLPEQDVSSGSSWGHDLGTATAPCIAHHPDSMIPQWSASWVPSHPSIPGPFHNSVLPLSPEVFHSSSQRSSSSQGYTPQ